MDKNKKQKEFYPLESENFLTGPVPLEAKRHLTGFTIIELLMVVAIIGLLVSIALVYLSNVRNEARDASLTAELYEVRNAAELYHSVSQTFIGVCDIDGTLSNNGDFGIIENGIKNYGGVIKCSNNQNKFAVVSTLNLGGCVCVDADGFFGELTEPNCASPLAAPQCPH